MILQAQVSEVAEILELTRACAKAMMAQNIFQWNEHYPSQEAFENDIERGELFVLKQENKLIGTVIISTHMDEEYVPIEWLTQNTNNYYIHRLAVHPNYQHKGYARQLMDYAEAFAKAKKAASIRLDTFSQNHRNQRFYEARGYQRLGSIFFPKQSKHPFYCYELVWQ